MRDALMTPVHVRLGQAFKQAFQCNPVVLGTPHFVRRRFETTTDLAVDGLTSIPCKPTWHTVSSLDSILTGKMADLGVSWHL